ncbi:MAG: hypothetical protein IKH51_01440, partial [Clostridia bacterium]|nr:hypothetical protein [Clostridia bacterium]
VRNKPKADTGVLMKNTDKTAAKPSDNKEKKTAAPENNRIRQMKKAVRYQIVLAAGTLLVVIVLVFAMTSAWYTNVAKTSSLSFTVDSWGYSPENITVSNEAFTVAPGTSGIIPLTIDNSSGDEQVKITVTVSKDAMASEIKQRLYFYADKSDTVNGEEVFRLYLGGTEADSYVYTIMPGQQLITSGENKNDVSLKWTWVYDRLGYYFRGTVTQGNAAGEGTVGIDEFIRPIEYDLDSAVFSNGELASVGSVTFGQLLTDISSHDGYDGTVSSSDAAVALNRKYYPVSVDSGGRGIWAYFCTESEINSGIVYDTDTLPTVGTITASLNFTAVNIPVQEETTETTAALTNPLFKAVYATASDIQCRQRLFV